MTMTVSRWNVLSILLLFVLTGTAGSAQPNPAGQRMFPAKAGGALSIQLNSGGCVEVRTWEEEMVRVSLEDVNRGLEAWSFDWNSVNGNLSLTAQLNDAAGPVNDLVLDITVPYNYNLDLRTAFGDLNIDHTIGVINAESRIGSIVVKNAVGVADLRLTAGNIKVTDATLVGTVGTEAGDVFIRLDNGWLDASTKAGNIHVELDNQDLPVEVVNQLSTDLRTKLETGLPDDYKLSSRSGRIEVLFPQDAASTLFATIWSTDGDASRIRSDYPLTTVSQSTHIASILDPPSPGNLVQRMQGTLKGSSHTMLLETVDGDIIISKQ